ncbi:MAG: nucleotidyltransferase family protein [Clostridia bacterium]|nr:nucleotidyltransferase family protein [Clostridia bacterium]
MSEFTVCAVVCEYDPFHNGHLYQLARAREITHARYMVCIMSGCITQRGSFSRYDRHLRALSALRHGADLVLELPVRFSCASAPEFAGGAVSIARRLGHCTHLSFGCEPDLIPQLDRIAALLRQEPDMFAATFRSLHKTGLSYPAAYARAMATCLQEPGLDEKLSAPNAILALQYLRALPEEIRPVPVVRIGQYHDRTVSAFSSAGALREAARDGRLNAENAALSMPDPDLYLAAEAKREIHPPDALSESLLYLIRTASPQELRAVCGMDEGLENRFLELARQVRSREELLAAVKTRRYTYAHLSRVCTCILLRLTRQQAAALPEPEYARILGFRRHVAPLLRAIAETEGAIPLISRARDLPRDSVQFRLDHRAQVLWSLGCACPERQLGNPDLTVPPVILD